MEVALPAVEGGMESDPELCQGQVTATWGKAGDGQMPRSSHLWLPGDHPTSSGPAGSFTGPGTRLGRTLAVTIYKRHIGV